MQHPIGCPAQDVEAIQRSLTQYEGIKAELFALPQTSDLGRVHILSRSNKISSRFYFLPGSKACSKGAVEDLKPQRAVNGCQRLKL